MSDVKLAPNCVIVHCLSNLLNSKCRGLADQQVLNKQTGLKVLFITDTNSFCMVLAD